jgi:iron(III) transport system substrate-binding protein
VKSALLEERIPGHLRDPNPNWFAFSTRARVIIYNKLKLKAADVRQLRRPGQSPR